MFGSARTFLVLWMSVPLCACTDRIFVAQTDGDGSTGTGPDDDDGTEAGPGPLESSSDDEGGPPMLDLPPPAPECIDVVLDAAVPVQVLGELNPGPSRFQPSCVDSQGAEVTFSFTAPESGTYVFDTVGSSIDAILYAYGPSCALPELACNDDIGGTLDASIGLPMRAGETAVVVLDSFGEAGAWVLNVERSGSSSCPEAALEPLPEVQIEDVLDPGGVDSVSPSCAGVGSDLTYVWTPPFAGRFRFSTAGSSFDTVLGLYEPDCLSELACNDDAQGDVAAIIDADVEAGVPVVIAVDSFEGNGGSFRLTIFPQ